MRLAAPSRRTATLLRSLCRGIAVVSGVFAFTVAVLMIANYIHLTALDPLDGEILTAMREMYRADTSGPYRVEIRTLDLLARKAFFQQQWQIRSGTWMLLVALGLLIICVQGEKALTARLPEPEGNTDGKRFWAAIVRARRALTTFGAVVAITAAVAIGLASRTLAAEMADRAGASDATETAAGANTANRMAVPDGYESNWPGFRGPWGNGVSFDSAPPTRWNGDSGEGIVWTAEIPLAGYSSPVVWGDRVFLSGADRDTRRMYCFDASDGSLLWFRDVGPFPGTPSKAPAVTEDTGYAASTPACDGKSAYAVFANGDIAALNFEGDVIWGRNLGQPDNHYGHSSSLIASGGRLFVQYDHATEARLLALDSGNGDLLWETPRDVETAWSSPILVDSKGSYQIIINANPFLAAYDASTGAELWRFENIIGEVASSPAYGDGRIIAVNQLLSVVAVSIDDGSLLWEIYDDLPDVGSPVVIEELVWISTSYGVVTCYGAEDGTIIWKEEFDEGFYASPILAADMLYLTDRRGVIRIVEAGREYVLLASPELGEPVVATPAFAGNRIFIRGDRHLFCIGAADDE